MELTQHNHPQTTTQQEESSQKEEGSNANHNADNNTKQSTKSVLQMENGSTRSTLDTTAHDIEGGSIHHDDGQTIDSISGLANLDFLLGAVLGLLAGPLSFLAVKCWHGMAQHDARRTKFLLGCSVGIILQIIALAIAFSVIKLSSRRG